MAALGFSRSDLIHRREIVLRQLLGAEGRLADDEVQVGMPVDPELDLAALDVGHGLGHVDGHCSGLRVGHQPARAENAAEPTDFAHHVGRGHDGVEVQVALRDLVDQLVGAHLVGASRNRGLGAVAGGEHQHPCRLAGAVGEVDGAADHLVRLTRVDPEPHGDVDRLVELRSGIGLGEIHRLAWRVQLLRSTFSRPLGMTCCAA